MIGAKDITYISLVFCFLLLIIPFLILYVLKVKIIKSLAISVIRMSIQLVLVGIFLQFIFNWDNVFANIAWLVMMISVASFSVIRSTSLNMRIFFFSIFASFMLSVVFVLIYFNAVVIGLDNIFQAKYIIAIGGMLLGNSLRGSIVGLNNIYSKLKRNEGRYLYSLSSGARKYEAILPYIRESLRQALSPTVASMATIGLVHLPGMMTGQILGGSDPFVAVKYQVTIMIAIFTATSISVVLSFLFSLRVSLDDYGILRKDIIKNNG